VSRIWALFLAALAALGYWQQGVAAWEARMCAERLFPRPRAASALARAASTGLGEQAARSAAGWGQASQLKSVTLPDAADLSVC
jgi:hypothetical protein